MNFPTLPCHHHSNHGGNIALFEVGHFLQAHWVMIRPLTSIGIAMGSLNLLQRNDWTLKSAGFVLYFREMHETGKIVFLWRFLPSKFNINFCMSGYDRVSIQLKFLDVWFFGQDCSSDRMSLLEILFLFPRVILCTHARRCVLPRFWLLHLGAQHPGHQLFGVGCWSHYDWNILKCIQTYQQPPCFFQGVWFNPALSVLDAFKKTCSWMFLSYKGWLKKQSFD